MSKCTPHHQDLILPPLGLNCDFVGCTQLRGKPMELIIVLAVVAVAYYFAAKNGHVPKFWEKDED